MKGIPDARRRCRATPVRQSWVGLANKIKVLPHVQSVRLRLFRVENIANTVDLMYAPLKKWAICQAWRVLIADLEP